MKKTALALLTGLVALAPGAEAQDPPAFVMGVYYRCNQGLEAQADEAVREALAPIVQRQIDAGNLTNMLWLTHDMGGAWRRLFATTGTDLGQMMAARQAIITEFTQEEEDAAERLSAACPGHDDYVWVASITSTTDAQNVGSASVSSYHMCDRSREGRADQIFRDVLAPLYQKHMDLGHLSSYGFYGHRVGGVFRRLETVSGADHVTVLNMQGAVYTEAFQNDPLAMAEFSDICQTHTDYLWSNAGN